MLAAWALVIGALTWFLADSQSKGRASLAQRLDARAQLGAEFISLYVGDVLAHERSDALSWLQAPHVSERRFESTTAGLGLGAAVLLDGRGRLLAVVPAKPSLLGHVMTGKYAHLAAAVAGHTAVSDVVASAARSLPVVALAVPFPAAGGRRVFSGAYQIAHTPLGTYLSHMIAIPGHKVFLIDATGRLIGAAALKPAGMAQTLAQADPRLAQVERARIHGSYSSVAGQQYFIRVPVSGTRWQVLVTVPESQLYASVDGPTKWLSWIAVAGFGLAGLEIILLVTRLMRSRRSLVELNAELDRLAHLDSLTMLKNRRATEEALEQTLSAARRHGRQLSMLLIDIDHFKRVNDEFGHRCGDEVLRHVADVLESTLRTEDVAGRWGGEEFVVILPSTDGEGAIRVAERLRVLIADTPAQVPNDRSHPVTVTIGAAEWGSESMEELVARADEALYAGKSAGRNTVALAQPAVAGEPQLV